MNDLHSLNVSIYIFDNVSDSKYSITFIVLILHCVLDCTNSKSGDRKSEIGQHHGEAMRENKLKVCLAVDKGFELISEIDNFGLWTNAARM